MSEREYFTTPVGRLVAGTPHNKQPVLDDNGNQKVNRNGEPMFNWFFAVAIPKGSEQHWSQTEWGQKVWQVGHAAFPNGQADSPAFAWKVVDGDSQIPNKKGIAPFQREGYPGNWVLNFATSLKEPDCYNADGSQRIPSDTFYTGCFAQVFASVTGNNSLQSPGVYLNPEMVAFAAHGERIHSGPDVSQAGFGGAPLPPGASTAPIAQDFAAQVPQAPAAPAVPGQPAAPAVPGQPAPAVPGQPAPAVPGQPAPAVPGQPAPAVPGQPAPAVPGQPVGGEFLNPPVIDQYDIPF